MPLFDSLALLASEGTFWLPPQNSSVAPFVDRAFYFILTVSAIFFCLIVSLAVTFAVRYRRRPGVAPQSKVSHNTTLEIVWSVIPLILVVVMFSLGFLGYMQLRAAPKDAYEIAVVAQKWKWTFRYPNGYEDPNLHVPIDEPVRLRMMSQDVIHSLFIPSFRVKMDVVPGRYTTAWFKAVRLGEEEPFDLVCTEYCGAGHSDMVAKVYVHAPGGFEKWLATAEAEQANLSPVAAGERLFQNRCTVCHKMDNSGTGPSLKGAFGQSHAFRNAPPQKVDENYIRESILDPSKKIREGYEDKMPPFAGQLPGGAARQDQQIDNLIQYIKSLQ